MARFIGIRHRRKRTAEGEARPTQVVILAEDGSRIVHYLENDTAELDFVLDRFPVAYRAALAGEDIAGFKPHQVRWVKLRKDQDPEEFGRDILVKEEDGYWWRANVPEVYEGLKVGDVVGMTLGGSGDRLAYAISRHGEETGVEIYRIPPFHLKRLREELGRDKDEDAGMLAELVRDRRHEFQRTAARDRDLIALTEAYRARMDALKARIGCAQRLHQQVVGSVFCSPEGKYPEGSIEVIHDERKASDRILRALGEEEAEREKELVRAIDKISVYGEVFRKIKGVGPMIAARLIVAVGDIRRFPSKAKLKAYLGVHVMQGGRFGDRLTEQQFARRRHGDVANWQADGRQALYLLADQFNRRPGTPWGQKLLEYKRRFRASHPVVECAACSCAWEDCRKKEEAAGTETDKTAPTNGRGRHVRRYTNGHIHKMALWRTVTKFVEWLYCEWSALERGETQTPRKAIG